MEGAFFNSGQSCCAVEVNCSTTLLFFLSTNILIIFRSVYTSMSQPMTPLSSALLLSPRYVSALNFDDDKLNNI